MRIPEPSLRLGAPLDLERLDCEAQSSYWLVGKIAQTPAEKEKPPNVTRSAFTTKASDPSPKPSSAQIDRRTTFTIVVFVSSTIMR